MTLVSTNPRSPGTQKLRKNLQNNSFKLNWICRGGNVVVIVPNAVLLLV
jgi:hypothetical protein